MTLVKTIRRPKVLICLGPEFEVFNSYVLENSENFLILTTSSNKFDEFLNFLDFLEFSKIF